MLFLALTLRNLQILSFVEGFFVWYVFGGRIVLFKYAYDEAPAAATRYFPRSSARQALLLRLSILRRAGFKFTKMPAFAGASAEVAVKNRLQI